MKNYEELISNKKYNKIQNFIFFAINFVIFLLISILLINIIKLDIILWREVDIWLIIWLKYLAIKQPP